jgi:hypothetical protein
MVDPKERLVYTHDRRGRPWWHGGRFVPAKRRPLEGEPGARTTPRDVIWDLKVGDRRRVQVTFDLRTLRLYARLIEPAE